MNRWVLRIAVALVAFADPAAAAAQGPDLPRGDDGGARAVPEPDLEIGVLTCNLQAQGGEPEAVAPSSEGQARSVLCVFKPRAGAEETYAGTIRGISLDGQSAAAVAWVVKAASNVVTPGMLQQSFNADQAMPADQPVRLVGEINPGVILRSLADKPEGAAGAKEKPRPRGFVVLGLQLKLKGATA